MWVFAYGSLMWNPGFRFRESRPALLGGWRRALCVYSYVYRGTRARPGLVFGLERGGECRGLAFLADDADAALEYLDRRELVGDVYERRLLPIAAGGESVRAQAYVVRPDHEQYAGGLSEAQAAELVANGVGQAGENLDYVRNTLARMNELGVEDAALKSLLAAAETRYHSR